MQEAAWMCVSTWDKKNFIQNPYTQERPIADKRLPVYLQDSWVSEHLADMWDSVSDPHL